MPDIPDVLKTIYAKLDSDPRFTKLGYEDQVKKRIEAANMVFSQNENYVNADIETKKRILFTTARQVPSLEDKNLQTAISTLIDSARNGDAASLSRVNSLAGVNSMGRSSVTGSAIGQAFGALGDSAPPQNDWYGLSKYAPNASAASVMPLTGKQSKGLMDGSDAAKLQTFFSDLGANDPLFKDMAKTAKQTAFIGNTIDLFGFIGAPGNALEGAGASLGKAIASKTSSRFLAAAAKILTPAVGNVIGGGAGNLIQKNTVAAIQSDPDLYTNTAKKVLNTFGEGAFTGFLLSAGLHAAGDYVLPAAAQVITGRKAEKAAFKELATNQAKLDGMIRDAGGTLGVPDDLIATLPDSVKDTAWNRNFTLESLQKDASTLDLDPLGQTAVATLDIPQVVFAPKDWKNPTGSGYRLWSVGESKGGLKPTLYGEAANVGDLRSKIADMLASSYDDADMLVKKESFVASKPLLNQGKVQAAVARAYDPFPETVSKDFTRPMLRGYLSPSEAQDATFAANANGGKAYKVKIDLTPEMTKRIADNKSFLVDGASLKLNPTSPENANAIAIISKPATADAIAAADEWAKKAVDAGKGWTESEARKFYLIQQGFDGTIDSASGTAETFFPSRMKLIVDQVDAKTGKLDTAAQARAAGGYLGNKVMAQAKIEASIGENTLVSNPKTLAAVATAKFKGNINAGDVQNFANQIADAKKLDVKGIRAQAVLGVIDKFDDGSAAKIIHNPDGSIVIHVPEKITNFSAQKSFIDDLVKNMDDIGKAKLPQGEYSAVRGAALSKALDKSPSRFVLPFGNEADNMTWLDSIAKSEFNGGSVLKLDNGKIALTDGAGKAKQTFDSIYEARDSMLKATLDEDFVRGDLYRQGFQLKGKKGQTYTLNGPGLEKPISGNNIQDLLDKIDYKPSSISNRLAPSEVIIDPTGVRATFDGKTATGSKSDIAKTLSKFEKPEELANMIGITHTEQGDMFKVADNYFRVDIPSLGATKYFDNAAEAKAYLESDLKDMRILKGAANSKGLSFYYDNTTGGYLVGDGTKVIQAKNAEEVQSILKGYPDAPGMREILTALDPQADEEVKAVIAQVDPELMKKWRANDYDRVFQKYEIGTLDANPSPNAKQGFMPDLRHAIRDQSATYDRYTEATVNRELGLKDFAKLRNEFKRAADARHIAADADKLPLAAVFTDANGKPMTLERRNALVAYKEALGVPESLAKAKEVFGDLTPHEQMRLAQLTKLTDSWANKFGIDPRTYVNGYVSHFKKYAISHMNLISEVTTADELLNQAFDGHPPKNLQAYFHNERAETLLNAMMEDDPLKIFQHYVEQGNKELYMKQPMQNVIDYINNNKDKIPRDVILHTFDDMQLLSGAKEMFGMAQAEALFDGIHKEMRKVPGLKRVLKEETPATGAKMFQSFMSLGYMGNIGMRPWVAAKNMLQPYQMLAPRIGLEVTDDAFKQVLSDGGKTIERLRNEGKLLGDVPVVAELGQGAIQKATRWSMGMMKSTDDITRAVPYVAAENLLDDGVSKWKRGMFKGDVRKFMDYVELDSIRGTSPELADQIAALATSGDDLQLKSAKRLFGKKLADEAMADMSLSAQPHMFNTNLPGYVFGRMGTYSTAYRENIYRGWQNAEGIAGKAKFATRFVGINLGIYEGLKAMNIKAADAFPGFGGLFGGSPQSQIAFDAIGSIGQGYDAEQSRARLVNSIKNTIPGTLHARYAKKFLDALDEGDLYGAFLAATTTPTVK